MNVLICEDNLERIKKFKRALINDTLFIVHASKDAIAYLRSGTIDVLFLDHDLGKTGLPEPSDEKSGYGVAEWLERNPKYRPKKIVVHSLNSDGAENIMRALPGAQYIPGVWDKL